MRIAGIVYDSIVDGIGLRDVLFVQGCNHRCAGCQNPHTWNYDGGYEMTPYDAALQFKDSNNDITISGGEPFDQPQAVIEFASHIYRQNPKKTIWIYTGYLYENIEKFAQQIYNLQAVVDGKFDKDLTKTGLLFRGSSNQRLIDVVKSRAQGKVIEYELEMNEDE